MLGLGLCAVVGLRRRSGRWKWMCVATTVQLKAWEKLWSTCSERIGVCVVWKLLIADHLGFRVACDSEPTARSESYSRVPYVVILLTAPFHFTLLPTPHFAVCNWYWGTCPSYSSRYKRLQR